ncbi:MAG: hypothetical protein EOS56_00650 [Mesorhizobium sp.]|nr:MAG: hypothetical protein EOS56_00650 [Mesorhizobium sp.]RWC67105.1 MAG: hypothetical protein EOS29_01480 [Mesorhizobium sp.]
MTKLSDLGPLVTGRRNGDPLENEADYFYLFPICGQPVDMRDLRQVMWHDRPCTESLRRYRNRLRM